MLQRLDKEIDHEGCTHAQSFLSAVVACRAAWQAHECVVLRWVVGTVWGAALIQRVSTGATDAGRIGGADAFVRVEVVDKRGIRPTVLWSVAGPHEAGVPVGNWLAQTAAVQRAVGLHAHGGSAGVAAIAVFVRAVVLQEQCRPARARNVRGDVWRGGR